MTNLSAMIIQQEKIMLHQQLEAALHQNDMTVPAEMQNKLVNYLQLMLAWNKVFNLTTITEPKDMIDLHLIDSLAMQPYLHGNRLLDVGSGAGLPGIPLAIINPEQQWTLLDKNAKKTRFLTQISAELGLKNVKVIHSACEDFHSAVGFDSILSRALGTIRLFIESTEHLLSPQGFFLAMKGKYPEEELNDIPSRFLVHLIKKFDIKGRDITRHVICLRKR